MREGDVPDVHAADCDRAGALRQFVEPVEQIGQRAFAAAGRAENAERRAGRNREADVVQDFAGRAVGEIDIFKRNVAVHRRLHRVFGVALRLGVENLEKALRADAGLGELAQKAAEAARRPDEHRIVGDEREVFALGDRAVDDEEDACGEDRDDL